MFAAINSFLTPPGGIPVNYLVIAGGGGGGGSIAGGGGAGGYLTGTASHNPGNTYTVTIGGGGAALPRRSAR